jgi:hypothetical protein
LSKTKYDTAETAKNKRSEDDINCDKVLIEEAPSSPFLTHSHCVKYNPSENCAKHRANTQRDTEPKI